MSDVFHGFADGSQLQYKIERAARPDSTVVFLNGSFFNYHQWDLLVSRLRRKAKEQGRDIDMVLLDYRGFSNARPLELPLAFTTLRDDVLEIMWKEHVTGDIRLVGASLGSMVGFSLMQAHPMMFSSFITYGFAAPVRELVQHVVHIFEEIKRHLEDQHVLPVLDDGRIDARSIVPVARTLWDIFVTKYSRTSESVKSKGFTEAYASYILKYMVGTPLKTIARFLDFFIDTSLVNQVLVTTFPRGMFERITAFHGEDDLVTPFPLVHDFATKVPAMRLVPVKKKGHTDYMLDGDVCDAMAKAILDIT